ncbi:alpha/beta fold hydrolase [Nesterenkonia xinjiangensis]|uniref:Acyl-coenzyme A synthetase/AMP-(Fatty) acid ligase/pimeloyl-ACP methyl ester carboxylesterase n=1 Tax=Nesterenkonia xinjiangensis TaxID=225327 RepID=A0A7Z0GPF3_9MICC|nr:alpha/beta fold hydrolase [Nesterenkonia xinjiangensis]NYJ79645.1 acyl-coenzyme A synthetase/AMP-(fatty) acid ligase/pimeloyl-ACP methyl ester carboxylesterase [Nesterenkonia xinjiangensis]
MVSAPRLSFRSLPAAHAQLPPRRLPGLDPAWSRLVAARTTDGSRTFHVLDTGPLLAERGIPVRGTILAVHGNPTWSYLWRGLLAESLRRGGAEGTAAGWRVIAPDQLDMGFSERLAHPRAPRPQHVGQHDDAGYRRLEQRLDDLDALMDALDVDTALPLVTLGHDWGGVISLGWAMRHPHDVDATATLNTAVDHPVEEHIPAALRAAMAPGLLTASTVETRGFLSVTLSLAEQGLDPEVRRAYLAPYRTRDRRGGVGGFVADIPARAEHVSRGALEEISSALGEWTKPSLVLWGPKDPVFQERHLADLQRRLPHADLHRFEGSGHLVAEDRDIASSVLTWLEGLTWTDGQLVPEIGGRRSPEPAAEIDGLHAQLAEMTAGWRRGSPAVVDMTGEEPATLSWQELSARIDALARGLSELGVARGDRVSLLVPPGNDLTVVLYACLRVGAVAVVADAGLGVRGMTRAARSARPEWIIGATPGLALARAFGWPGRRISVQALSSRQARLLGTVASVERLLRSHVGRTPEVPAPAPEDEAAVLFTSGSTGPAKGVIYTHGRLAALVALLRRQFDVVPGSSLIAGFAPFALLGPAIGATSVTPDMSVTKPATLTAVAVAEAALAGEATMFFGSPAALRNVVATGADLDPEQRAALRRIALVLSAGAPVHPDLLDAVQELFPTAEIHTPYGMTEGLLQADIDRGQVHEAMATRQSGVCVGRPVAGVHVALAPLDAEGRPAEELVVLQEPPQPEAVGVLAEVVVSAAHMKAGYDRLWDTDRASSRDDADGLLWHRTNDVGHVDAEGRLWIEGRLQHVITAPGGPVGPGSVETPVDALEEVARSAAVGVGPVGTQSVVVIVEPQTDPGELSTGRSPLATPEFAAAVRGAAGDVPVSAVLVLEELPTDIRHNSKIDRTRLAVWADRALTGRRPGTP